MDAANLKDHMLTLVQKVQTCDILQNTKDHSVLRKVNGLLNLHGGLAAPIASNPLDRRQADAVREEPGGSVLDEPPLDAGQVAEMLERHGSPRCDLPVLPPD